MKNKKYHSVGTVLKIK